MDSQVVELLGRNRLVDELLRAGLEVASPVRDRGIDLIAYLDLSPGLTTFRAFPIQMKACSSAAFSLDAKYAKFPNLILAYIWHIDEPQQEVTYAMTYEQALGVADGMGWTKTESWAAGKYANTQPGAKLKSLLEPYRTTPDRWRSLVMGEAQASVPEASSAGEPVKSTEDLPSISLTMPRSQRDVMRDIHRRFGSDHGRIISEYAAAERRGEVKRRSNGSATDAEAYARALLNDGLVKGWL